ncbi:2,3-bisphosphoglycerate-dependent phosphoglycerate mutase [Deinococcus humi]|uniref:2,3-bisphosphoglycerate-dependent phosphoglycerate mutase n=2 Tax=Deinococcus humi TaxID=662880 RepID=A0A7W8JZT0_9DEIO|nr:2,3-bisphosphoglycerate-dependent phosphoglycerate mutase [Deinococcus humi]
MLRELLQTPRAWFKFGDTSFATVGLNRRNHTAVVTGVNLCPHLPAGQTG